MFPIFTSGSRYSELVVSLSSKIFDWSMVLVQLVVGNILLCNVRFSGCSTESTARNRQHCRQRPTCQLRWSRFFAIPSGPLPRSFAIQTSPSTLCFPCCYRRWCIPRIFYSKRCVTVVTDTVARAQFYMIMQEQRWYQMSGMSISNTSLEWEGRPGWSQSQGIDSWSYSLQKSRRIQPGQATLTKTGSSTMTTWHMFSGLVEGRYFYII